MSSVGSAIDGVRASPVDGVPYIAIRTSWDGLRHQALGRRHRDVRPTLPGHARRASARCRAAPPAIRISRGSIILCPPSGLQPEKGHARAYTSCRELTQQARMVRRVLDLCDSRSEVQRLIVQAKEWANDLERRSRLGSRTSRRPSSRESRPNSQACHIVIATTISCATWPSRSWILEADSHAKVQMRKKVRAAESRTSRP